MSQPVRRGSCLLRGRQERDRWVIPAGTGWAALPVRGSAAGGGVNSSAWSTMPEAPVAEPRAGPPDGGRPTAARTPHPGHELGRAHAGPARSSLHRRLRGTPKSVSACRLRSAACRRRPASSWSIAAARGLTVRSAWALNTAADCACAVIWRSWRMISTRNWPDDTTAEDASLTAPGAEIMADGEPELKPCLGPERDTPHPIRDARWIFLWGRPRSLTRAGERRIPANRSLRDSPGRRAMQAVARVVLRPLHGCGSRVWSWRLQPGKWSPLPAWLDRSCRVIPRPRRRYDPKGRHAKGGLRIGVLRRGHRRSSRKGEWAALRLSRSRTSRWAGVGRRASETSVCGSWNMSPSSGVAWGRRNRPQPAPVTSQNAVRQGADAVSVELPANVDRHS